ncbi:MAG: hypothetical protein KIS66_11875 [Fimbriimonadaceae bacterium]|nr:hypothetical protein [Fimbriimonadaceae bacterium]
MNPARSAIDRLAAALVALGLFSLIVAGVLFVLPLFGQRFALVTWRGGFLNLGVCALIVGFALRFTVMPGTFLRRRSDGGHRWAYLASGVFLIAVPWLVAWLMEMDRFRGSAGAGIMAFLSACVTVPVGCYFILSAFASTPSERDRS